MAESATYGDLLVTGALIGPTSIAYPLGSITNDKISASAAISASKLQKSPVWIGGQSGTAATKTFNTFVKGATGTLKYFTAVCQTACSGSSTVTIDLQVNGVSVLAAVITINSATSINTELVAATISSPDLEDGDRLSVVITANQAGTDALAADIDFRVDWDEDYAA